MPLSAGDKDLFDFLDEVEQIDHGIDGVAFSTTTRDDICMELCHGVATTPMEYAYNSWLNNIGDDRGPRSEGVIIGLDHHYANPRMIHSIILTPHGKDVHTIQMDAEQARRVAAMLVAYAGYLDKLKPSK